MNQTHTDFYLPDDEQFYSQDAPQMGAVDLEQVDQFQPETAPRSTTSASTDLYASSQSEAQRYRDQGDPNEYDFNLYEDLSEAQQ